MSGMVFVRGKTDLSGNGKSRDGIYYAEPILSMCLFFDSE